MFEGFSTQDVEAGGVTIRVRRAGDGPPLLLLHGYPQTHAMWHRVAPALTAAFTVGATDLSGYGDSSAPAGDGGYSKRAMAAAQAAVMEALGFGRFAVAGHDRGARVAYRMALDHPDVVTRLAVLDVIPTSEMYRRTDMRMALGAWHWFLLPQPAPMPERMLAADPVGALIGGRASLFAPEALAEYERCVHDPKVIHAICEDYRAGAGIDRALDEADEVAGRRIACPVLALWGATGPVARLGAEEVWRRWADDLTAAELPCGHHLPEEAPEETLAALRGFFGG
jgi:haloacetate dehalogenase